MTLAHGEAKVAAARVVIVDDEEVLLDATSRILRRVGYEVLPANRPHVALEVIANNGPIDLVISDVVMPEMRGTELILEVARITPRTARLLITGGLLDPAEVPDDVAVVRKPFSAATLISAVSAALKRSAKISDDLARNCQKSAELQVQSNRLISECQNVVCQSAETIGEVRAQRTRQQNDVNSRGKAPAS